MRAQLILNTRSRRGDREGAAVRETLERLGLTFCEDGSSKEPVDCVIAAGGDGTIVSAVSTAIERRVPLGIVPLGTFNDLARALGVPLDVEAACAAISDGRTRTIDVGRVNGVHFVNEASIGLSTRIARRQTPEVKKRFGFLGILSTTLQSIGGARPFYARVSHGERTETFRCIQLTVANGAHFGGFIDRKDAAIDDGYLDLYTVDVESWLQAFLLARKIVTRDPSSGEGLGARRAAAFAVHTHHRHHVSADGEPAGFTPALFELLPLALRVFIP